MRVRLALIALATMFCVTAPSWLWAGSGTSSTILREQTSRTVDTIENQVREAARPASRGNKARAQKEVVGSDRKQRPGFDQRAPAQD